MTDKTPTPDDDVFNGPDGQLVLLNERTMEMIAERTGEALADLKAQYAEAEHNDEVVTFTFLPDDMKEQNNG